MRYSNLKFFNGVENELNLTYDEVTQKWSGSVHIPEVSSGLYESVNLFILEEFMDSDLGYKVYGKPTTENSSLSEYNFTFEWVDDRWASGDIFLFDSYLENDVFKIRQIDKLTLGVEDPSTIVNSVHPTTHIKSVSNYINEALQVNVAISSEDDKAHYRTLRIKDSEGNIVATIKFYGEVEVEDDRLNLFFLDQRENWQIK